jgi:hypothetical protein
MQTIMQPAHEKSMDWLSIAVEFERPAIGPSSRRNFDLAELRRKSSRVKKLYALR